MIKSLSTSAFFPYVLFWKRWSQNLIFVVFLATLCFGSCIVRQKHPPHMIALKKVDGYHPDFENMNLQ